jgi:hypothetical protein
VNARVVGTVVDVVLAIVSVITRQTVALVGAREVLTGAVQTGVGRALVNHLFAGCAVKASAGAVANEVPEAVSAKPAVLARAINTVVAAGIRAWADATAVLSALVRVGLHWRRLIVGVRPHGRWLLTCI